MATIPHQTAKIGGTVLTPTAATAGPDNLLPGDRLVLIVQNGGGVATTVTVTVPGNTKYGQAEPDVTTVSIPASGLAAIGPLPGDLADPVDGLVDVDANPNASVNFYAVRI